MFFFDNFSEVYKGNNESAKALSRAYEKLKESKSALLVNRDNQNLIGHTVLFYKPMEMFQRIPFTDTLKETSWVHLKASEGISSTYTFLKKMQGGGLIKLADAFVTAEISIRKANGNKFNASTICDYVPRPLTSWWKSINVSSSGMALSVSHTDNLIVSNIFSCLFERKNAKEDLYDCNMGWEHKAGHEKYLHKVTVDDSANDTRKPITDNDGAYKRIKSIVNVNPHYCIEKMLMPFFNSGDQYVPTNNSFKVK